MCCQTAALSRFPVSASRLALKLQRDGAPTMGVDNASTSPWRSLGWRTSAPLVWAVAWAVMEPAGGFGVALSVTQQSGVGRATWLEEALDDAYFLLPRFNGDWSAATASPVLLAVKGSGASLNGALFRSAYARSTITVVPLLPLVATTPAVAASEAANREQAFLLRRLGVGIEA
nr:hypothetical protein Iba_chr05fCG8340 [Ipomoea batatas]